MITVTHERNGQRFERTFDDLGRDEQDAINYIAARYPNLTPDERRTIRVVQNGLKVTNSTLCAVEERLRAAGWAILDPIGKERQRKPCPYCASTSVIKIGRYPNNRVHVRCLDCQRESAYTNGEYYVDAVDEDQE